MTYLSQVWPLKKNCRKYLASSHGTSPAEMKVTSAEVMVMTHNLATALDSRCGWIVDFGATCHKSNDEAQFVDLRKFPSSLEVTLSDGHSLE